MHEIVWNALQDTNSQSGVTCPFFLLRGAQSSSPYVLDSGRSATWDSYKTDNLATNVTNLHFSAGCSIVQICCANVFLNEFKNRKKKEKRKKQVQQIWFSAKRFCSWPGQVQAWQLCDNYVLMNIEFLELNEKKQTVGIPGPLLQRLQVQQGKIILIHLDEWR